MNRSKIVQFLTLVALITLMVTGSARAEDTKGKWQFGLGISFFSTTDYIRSNSDIILTDGSIVDENGLPAVRYVDERPDANILNEPTIADDFAINFSASYGLTRWFAVELAGSYLQAPVGNIEFYTEDSTRSIQGSGTPLPLNICGPNLNQTCFAYTSSTAFTTRTNSFLPIGELTSIPVQLSGIVRFRPESPFDPYIGLGVGYIFSDLATGDEFNERAAEINNLIVGSISKGEITDSTPAPDPRGSSFQLAPLQAEVDNAFQWHAVGGVDYYMTERYSFYVDARYVWTGGAVEISTDGAHQVRITVPDLGTLQLNQKGSSATPGDYYLWEDRANKGYYNSSEDKNGDGKLDAGEDLNSNNMLDTSDFHTRCLSNTIGYDCQNSGLFETEDKNLNGTMDNCPTCEGGTEDDGWIIVMPPGSSDPGEQFDDLMFYCPDCDGNGGGKHPSSPIRLHIDTEDSNFNSMMDRFIRFGIDACTDPNLAPTLEGCLDRLPPESTIIQKFVYPEGCSGSIPSVANISGRNTAEGCPPQQNIDARNTGVDDTADVFIIQGGDIRFGGFGITLGFKITF